MASSPIISWQIEGGKVEAVIDFLFLGSKIAADGQHSHETSRQLLLGRKVMTNLHSVFNSKDITLLTKVRIVMYGCESWTINKADLWRIDAFKLWCWRRLLRVPQKVRRSNQLNFKEINAEYSLEGLMLKLRLQHLGYLMQPTDTLQKILMLRKIEGRRRKGQQRMRWLDGIDDSLHMNLGKF